MADRPTFHLAEPARGRSPLDGWSETLARLPSTVRLDERPFLVQLDVRVGADDAVQANVAQVLGGPLPTTPATATRAGGHELLWLGPDEWLVLAEPGETALEPALRAAIGSGAGAVTDVSAQRTVLTLAGAAAAQVLARGCSIDLHPWRAPRGTCVQTLLARTGVIIVVGNDNATSFELLVRSSFAEYLAAWLVDACTELRT
jgi:sarcosine oxidase subunit gamma